MRPKIDLKGLLASLPLFSQLAPEQLETLAGRCREVRVARHRYLFRRGEAAHGLYVVSVGQIKLSLPSLHGDPEKVIEFFGPGQSFGEAVMFLDRDYLVDAQALEDSYLVLVQKEDVLAALDRDPAFARGIVAALSQRLHTLMQDIETVNLHSAQQRVIGYLLKLPREGNRARFTVDKRIVASKLGLTPSTLSRCLRALSKATLISVAGPEVAIHNYPDLERRFVAG